MKLVLTTDILNNKTEISIELHPENPEEVKQLTALESFKEHEICLTLTGIIPVDKWNNRPMRVRYFPDNIR